MLCCCKGIAESFVLRLGEHSYPKKYASTERTYSNGHAQKVIYVLSNTVVYISLVKCNGMSFMEAIGSPYIAAEHCS